MFKWSFRIVKMRNENSSTSSGPNTNFPGYLDIRSWVDEITNYMSSPLTFVQSKFATRPQGHEVVPLFHGDLRVEMLTDIKV